MYRIKQLPEDFIVEEENEFDLDASGRYALVSMKKINYDTVKAVSRIARALHIADKKIGFAGNKDRNAVTTQYISIENVSKDRIESLKLKAIVLEYKGRIKDRINLGYLEGNRFTITVRNLDDDTVTKKPEHVANYFGEQRFSKNNAKIGKLLIIGEFKKAVELIDDDTVKDFLSKNPRNHIGAFRTLPKKIQRLYVHAYQSHLWNKAVESYLNKPRENIDFPVIGFDSELDDEIEDIYDRLLEEEDITFRDFIIRQIPELSCDGSSRRLFMDINDFTASKLQDDELNKGKKKIILKFKLDKGSYATTLVKHLFS